MHATICVRRMSLDRDGHIIHQLVQVQQGTAQQRCHLRSMELQGHRRHRPGQVWAKMYVPSDSFNGLSPEKKAATHLRAMQTFVACK